MVVTRCTYDYQHTLWICWGPWTGRNANENENGWHKNGNGKSVMKTNELWNWPIGRGGLRQWMNFEEEEKTELNSVLLHFSIAVQSASRLLFDAVIWGIFGCLDECVPLRAALGSLGIVTRRCISDLWTLTGNVFVKKSARLRAPCRHVTMNWFYEIRSLIQWKRMSIDLDLLCLTVLLASPTAHALSQRMSVGCCG